MNPIFSCSVLLALAAYSANPWITLGCLGWGIFLLRDKRILVFLILLMVISFPSLIPPKTLNNNPQGRVVEIHENYLLLESQGTPFVVYTSDSYTYDQILQIEGTLQTLEASPTFYGYDWVHAWNKRGITQSVFPESIHLVQPTSSIRGWVYQELKKREGTGLFIKLIFNIEEEGDLFPFLHHFGILLSSFLFYIRRISGFFLREGAQKRGMVIVTGLLVLFYQGTFLSVRLFFMALLGLFSLSRIQRLALYLSFTALFYPHVLGGLVFLYPLLFYLPLNKGERYLALMLLQSLFTQQVNFVLLVLYRFLGRALVLFGFVMVPLSFFGLSCEPALSWLNQTLMPLLEQATLKGNLGLIGLGCLYFVHRVYPRNLYRSWVEIGVCWTLLATSWCHPFPEVTLINVGQGSAALIRYNYGKTNLVFDTGKPFSYRALQTMLDAKGIKTIDLLLLSHADEDHSGNKENLVRDYQVLQVVEDRFNTIEIDGLTLYDLNPGNEEDENDDSLVVAFKLGGQTFLFPGDISQSQERKILQQVGPLPINILVLPHHGSNTSSSTLFLSTLKPDLALISSGLHNRYHHPSEEVLQKLLGFHIPFLNTQVEGDISIFFVGKLQLIETANSMFGIMAS